MRLRLAVRAGDSVVVECLFEPRKDSPLGRILLIAEVDDRGWEMLPRVVELVDAGKEQAAVVLAPRRVRLLLPLVHGPGAEAEVREVLLPVEVPRCLRRFEVIRDLAVQIRVRVKVRVRVRVMVSVMIRCPNKQSLMSVI